jgi:alpha/beta superfamily hydrolase
MNSIIAKKSEMAVVCGPEGDLEAIFSYVSRKVTHLAILCHPHPLYGGTMHNKVVYSMATALNQIGFATVRFNFRGVGRSAGSFNYGIGERRDVEAVIRHYREAFPKACLLVGGFSFGAKVGLLAGSADEHVSALLGVGAAIDVADFSFLEDCEKPKMIVQGSEDQYGSMANIREWFARLREPKRLTVIQGAVHLFDGKLPELKNAIIEGLPMLLESPIVAGRR